MNCNTLEIIPSAGAAIAVVPRYVVGIKFVRDGVAGREVIARDPAPPMMAANKNLLGRPASFVMTRPIGPTVNTTTKALIPP